MAERRLGDLLDDAAARLARAGIAEPRAEATILACRTFGLERTTPFAHPELLISQEDACRFAALVERRARHEPLAYLIGEREFYGRPFHVDPRVLIPRPETELLVELALQELRHSEGPALVVDVGTGSGCIAATLALELPSVRVIAVDISWEALQVARLNLERYGLERRVQLVQGDLLTWLAGPADLVVANLPYVPAESLSALPPDVLDYEPKRALCGGPGGASLILALLQQASRIGVNALLAELDPRHAREVLETARLLFPQRSIDIRRDLAGWERILWIRGAR